MGSFSTWIVTVRAAVARMDTERWSNKFRRHRDAVHTTLPTRYCSFNVQLLSRITAAGPPAAASAWPIVAAGDGRHESFHCNAPLPRRRAGRAFAPRRPAGACVRLLRQGTLPGAPAAAVVSGVGAGRSWRATLTMRQLEA